MQTREHPDELTPREREVLDFLRLGLTNEEIAQRLGISLDGAKYHVSQILSKLGVARREEAAAAEAGKPRLRPQWRALWPAVAMMAGGAIMLAAAGGLAILAWGVSITGSGDGSSSPGQQVSSPIASEATPVPWVDSTPGPTPSPSPFPSPDPADQAVRACRADDLKAEPNDGNGAGGFAFMYFAFSNLSAEPCRLEGVPAMRFLDSNGQAVPTDWREAACLPAAALPCAQLVAVLQPDSGQTVSAYRSLKPSQAGLTLMYYSRLEDVPSYTPCPYTAAAIGFDLPGNGGRVVVPLSSPMNACVSPGVSQFIPAPTPTPAPETKPHLTARLHLPDSVVAGSTLRFVAELSNTSATAPFVFGDLCPTYMVILGSKDAYAWHSLNCGAANSIPPSGTVPFAMELAIPAEVSPGEYAVDWVLNSTTYVGLGGTTQTEKTPYRINVVAP